MICVVSKISRGVVMVSKMFEMDHPQRLQDEEEEDRTKLLAIFSEEMWQLILKQVDIPEDLINCAKASTFLGEVLEPRRTVYLFPQVLQILDDQGYLNTPNSSLLQCRLVCSTWKQAVNHLLQIRPYHSHCRMVRDDCSDYKTDHSTDPAYSTYFRFFKFSIGELQTKIIPELSSPYYRENCPFPSRHLEIIEMPSHSHYTSYMDFLNDLDNYRRGMEKLLEKVGHHFWHAVIEFQTCIKHQQVWRLQKYLKLMPNLKSLYIVGSYVSSMSWYDYNYKSGENLPQIWLPNLNLLSICGGYEPLLFQLVRAAENAKIVEVRRRIWCDRNIRNRRIVGFPIGWINNPEKLAIEIFSEKEFQDLNESWELKLVLLKMDNVAGGTLSWAEIFGKLEAYQNTLEELTIVLPTEVDVEEKRNLWKESKELWYMPSLKILDLKTHDFCSLEFLLGLQNLEEVYLRFGNREESVDLREGDMEGEKADWRRFDERKFIEYKVWNLIPSLKQVYLDRGDGNGAMKYSRGEPPIIWKNPVSS